MNGALLLGLCCALFFLAYSIYGRIIMRLLGVDPNRPTPAHTMRDGVDYLPTHPMVLFGHHFASIAGAGPIVGPVLAAQYGWLAVALWVVVGGIFIGAAHDLAALYLSLRHQGRSIGTIIEGLMGYPGRMIFLAFCWFTLILVVAEFTRLVAQTFISTPAVATASLLFIMLAVIFGLLLNYRILSLLTASIIFVPLAFGCVWLGTCLPLDLVALTNCQPQTALSIWITILLGYCILASILPVWILLQPRDYLNSYLLYAMMLLGFAGILLVMPHLELPALTGWHATNPVSGSRDPLLPLLFVTVACGACSGFHALVASGTTAKQVDREDHIRPIAYGGMLVEGALAITALVAVAALSKESYSAAMREHGAVYLFANGIANFTTRLGLPHQSGMIFISLSLAAFLMTTLDTATRLARFTWQEMLLPRTTTSTNTSANTQPAPPSWHNLLANRYTATLLTVATIWWLLHAGGAKSLWPIFASSNQLLAALTLLGCVLWLKQSSRSIHLFLWPMLFMITTSGWAVTTLFIRNLKLWYTDGIATGGAMTITSAILIIMALALLRYCCWIPVT